MLEKKIKLDFIHCPKTGAFHPSNPTQHTVAALFPIGE